MPMTRAGSVSQRIMASEFHAPLSNLAADVYAMNNAPAVLHALGSSYEMTC